jgi:sugar (pentulose or hexulose) kinase
VIDVGKTHAKLSLIRADGTVVARRRIPNTVRDEAPYPHADADRLFDWMCAVLRDACASHPVERVICTTHGATAALLTGDTLAFPVMDYEWSGFPELDAEYERLRDGFQATLSPSLPVGLNLARQIHWQSRRWADRYAQVDRILPYPQYWAWRLCGEFAAEVSSLGSHTDLWCPLAGVPSALAVHLGVDRRLPPLHAASTVLGEIDPRRLGCGSRTPITVHCGVHDSSAAYVAQFPDPARSGTVVSTGTWVVCMSRLAEVARLDPQRDTSGTVSVFGAPLGCSRFMGGREFAAIAGERGIATVAAVADLATVLESGVIALPAFAASGPFQPASGQGGLFGPEPESAVGRATLAALYCALITDVCLGLIGACGDIVIDGPFAANPIYLGVLAALRPEDQVFASVCPDGPTLGAAALAYGAAWHGTVRPIQVSALLPDEISVHRERWHKLVHKRLHSCKIDQSR